MIENYRLLQTKNRPLYDLVQNVALTNDVMPIKAKNDEWTLKVKTVDNKEIYTNSKYNPRKDIEKVINTVDVEASTIFCIGIGLGYEVNELLLRKARATKIVIIEPRLDILKAALEYSDLSDILSSEYISILGGEVSQINLQLNFLKRKLVYIMSAQPEVFINSYGLRVYEQPMIQSIINEMKNTVISFSRGLGNSAEDTLLGINHTFSNLEQIYRSPNISTLKNVYQGYPAICVAAGPSLDKNIEILKKVQDKALIFCADTIYQKLLNHGIIPDGIATIERPKIVYNYFYKGKKFDPRTCLLASTVVYPKILEEYPGPKVIFSRSTTTFEKTIADAIPTINCTNIGLSCAHINFAAAKLLNCNPIILVGQDLSYSKEGNTHAKGTYAEENSEEEDNKKGMQLLEVKNYHGDGMVKTTGIWDMFRRWFEDQIATDQSTIFLNATEGGAHIEGAKPMGLSEAADLYLYKQDNKMSLSESITQNNNLEDTELIRKKAVKFIKRESQLLKKVKQQMKEVENKFIIIDRMVNKRQDKAQLTMAASKLTEAVGQLTEVWGISSHFKQVTLPIGVQVTQFISSQPIVEGVKSFREYYQYIWKKVQQLQQLVDITLKEYERGLKISRTGMVDTIETALMGEMYEE